GDLLVMGPEVVEEGGRAGVAASALLMRWRLRGARRGDEQGHQKQQWTTSSHGSGLLRSRGRPGLTLRLYDGGGEGAAMSVEPDRFRAAAMIAPAELAALRDRGAAHALLDVRERLAYERGHIFRATSLPRRLLEFRLPVLLSGRATPIVLCDDDG